MPEDEIVDCVDLMLESIKLIELMDSLKRITFDPQIALIV